MKMNFIPFSDGYGIVGYHWACDCGKMILFAWGGEECVCGFVVPDVDPCDWYVAQMKLPTHMRDWNRKVISQ